MSKSSAPIHDSVPHAHGDPGAGFDHGLDASPDSRPGVELVSVTCSSCSHSQQIGVPDDHLQTRIPEVAVRLAAGRPDDYDGSDAEYLAWWAQLRWECSACSAYNSYRPASLDEFVADPDVDQAVTKAVAEARIPLVEAELAGLRCIVAGDTSGDSGETAGK